MKAILKEKFEAIVNSWVTKIDGFYTINPEPKSLTDYSINFHELDYKSLTDAVVVLT